MPRAALRSESACTFARNSGSSAVKRSERTTTISLGVGSGGKLAWISAAARFDSGLLVTSPSLVNALPSSTAITTKEASTSATHTATVRFG